MNPWDTKLTHELTDSEMYAFCTHLERLDVVGRETQIKACVDRAVAWWTQKRGQPQWNPGGSVYHESISTGLTGNWWSENATIPASARMCMHVLQIRLPDGLPSDHVPYLAEMQVREQWDGY